MLDKFASSTLHTLVGAMVVQVSTRSPAAFVVAVNVSVLGGTLGGALQVSLTGFRTKGGAHEGAGVTHDVPAALRIRGGWQTSGGIEHWPVALFKTSGATHVGCIDTQFAPEAMSGTGHVQPAPAGI